MVISDTTRKSGSVHMIVEIFSCYGSGWVDDVTTVEMGPFQWKVDMYA